jgi:hypothetical protein
MSPLSPFLPADPADDAAVQAWRVFLSPVAVVGRRPPWVTVAGEVLTLWFMVAGLWWGAWMLFGQ